jgi:hypothetical protein
MFPSYLNFSPSFTKKQLILFIFQRITRRQGGYNDAIPMLRKPMITINLNQQRKPLTVGATEKERNKKGSLPYRELSLAEW